MIIENENILFYRLSLFYKLKNRIIYRLQKDIYKEIKINLDSIEINNNYNLLLQRACAKIFIEQYKDAIKDFSEIIKAKTNINNSNILLFRAYTYYLNKQYTNTKKDICNVLKKDKNNVFANNLKILVNYKPEVFEKEFRSLYNLKNFTNLIIENTISYFEKLIEIDNKNYKYYLYLAISLFVKQDEDFHTTFDIFLRNNNNEIILDLKNILNNLQRALILNKGCAVIYILIGLVKYFILNIKSKIEYKKKANKNFKIKITNKNIEKETFEYFDKALELDSSLIEVYYLRALINFRLQINEKQAMEDIERCVLLAKENKHIYCFDIINILEQGLGEELEIDFAKKIIELAPPNSKEAFFANEIILAISLGLYGIFTTNKELITSYENIIKSKYYKCNKDLISGYPDHIKSNSDNYYIANAYYELEEYDKCINFVKKVKDKKSWLTLSNAFLAKKDYKKAIFNYKKFISMPVPKSDNYYEEFSVDGVYYAQQKEIDIATAYFKIGYCYEKLENINKAILAYKESIKNFKWLQGNESAYYNLAVIYTKQKKYKQAIEYYNEAEKIFLSNRKYLLENEQKNSSIFNKANIQKYNKILNYLYFNRGNVFLELANYNCALKDFEKALDYDATDLQAISNIIDIYRKQKNIEKIKEYTKLLNSIGDN